MQAVTTVCCCSDTVQQKFLSGFPQARSRRLSLNAPTPSFDQQIRPFVLLRARADSSRDGSNPQGLHHIGSPDDMVRIRLFPPPFLPAILLKT